MRHIRRTLALAACLAVAAPAVALAGQPRLLGNVNNATPTVTAGPDGAFHAVFNDEDANVIIYCRITPQSIAGPGQMCTQRTAIGFNDSADGTSSSGAPDTPWIVADEPGLLRLVLPQYVSGKTYTWTSTDNGTSWSGPTMLGKPDHGTDSERPLFEPATHTLLMPSWNPGAYINRAHVDGSDAGSERVRAALSGGGQSFLIYNLSAGRVPGATVATADNLDRVAYWRLPDGADANDGAAWGEPTVIGAGTDSTMGAGNGQAWVGYTTKDAGPSRLVMRRWTGTGFASPKTVERVPGYLADVYVAANGVPGVAYRRNGTGLRFAELRPGAQTFTTRTIVRNDDVFHDLVLAQDGAGRGVAVWSRANAVYAADLTEVFDPAAPRVNITETKKGVTLGLNMPGGCVRPGKPISLSTSGQGKARLTKVVYRVGPLKATDTTAPWGVKLTIPKKAKPGTSLPVKATMTLRTTKKGKMVGPPFTRVLVGSLTVCS